jgi:hypothetical protein
MIIHTDEPLLKFIYTTCEVCGRYRGCTWHHIGLRRYCNLWIWVCIFDGINEGCHERIHRDIKWAYENGYLIKHNNILLPIKMKEKHKCDHKHKTYNKIEDGKLKIFCGMCNQEVKECNFGDKTQNKGKITPKTTIKLGYEPKNLQREEAVKLKRKYDILKYKSKNKFLKKEDKFNLEKEIEETRLSMLKLDKIIKNS